MIRSVGGWSEVKRLRRKGQDHVMSDKRILGDSEFVDSVLFSADEKYERHYELKRRGYDLEMSPPGVGLSVERGEAIAREDGYLLID